MATPTSAHSDNQLLVDIGFDSPSNEFGAAILAEQTVRDKMVSEVGSERSENFIRSVGSMSAENLDAQVTNMGSAVTDFRRNLFEFDPVRIDEGRVHNKQPIRSISAEPGVPHCGELWNNTSSPVILFRGARSAPVYRTVPSVCNEVLLVNETHNPELSTCRPATRCLDYDETMLTNSVVESQRRQHFLNENVRFEPLNCKRYEPVSDCDQHRNNSSSANKIGIAALYASLTDQLKMSGFGWEDIEQQKQINQNRVTENLCEPVVRVSPSVPKMKNCSGDEKDMHVVDMNHTLPYEFNEQSACRENRVLPVEHTLPCASSERTQRVIDVPSTTFSPQLNNGGKRDTMKPQVFDGKEPVNSFLAHFEVCAQFNNWSIEQRASWLQWSLKGRAQQILWDLPPEQLTSYEKLVSSLRQRFGSENQTEVYKIELRNRRRGPHESLSSLMQDIRRLMVLAYSAATSDIWESVAINAFLEALDDPELSLEIRKRGPTNFDSAYRDALLLEGFKRASARPESVKGRNQNVRATSDVDADTRREIENLKSQLKQQETRHSQQIVEQSNLLAQQMREMNTNTNRQQSNCYVTSQPVVNNSVPLGKVIICFACGAPGHTKPNCPNRVAFSQTHVQTDHSQNLNPKSGLSPGRVCYNCGQNSHLIRDCPTKKANTTVVNYHVSGSRSAYLPVTIYGKKRWCLLDTGSKVSVIPRSCVEPSKIMPCSQTINAANGTIIPVLGETELPLVLGTTTIKVRCLVSEHVSEILLGLSFLEDNGCIWDFPMRRITIHNKSYSLSGNKPTGAVRRIVLQKGITIPPR